MHSYNIILIFLEFSKKRSNLIMQNEVFIYFYRVHDICSYIIQKITKKTFPLPLIITSKIYIRIDKISIIYYELIYLHIEAYLIQSIQMKICSHIKQKSKRGYNILPPNIKIDHY